MAQSTSKAVIAVVAGLTAASGLWVAVDLPSGRGRLTFSPIRRPGEVA
jgi:hypothetical protein